MQLRAEWGCSGGGAGRQRDSRQTDGKEQLGGGAEGER